MTTVRKVTAIIFVLFVFCHQTSVGYESPRRAIEVKPYLHFLFPSNLLDYERRGSMVENETGFGAGLKVRTQLSGPFGFTVNAAVTDGEAKYERTGFSVIFTAGPHYSLENRLGAVVLEVSYGVISVADCSETLLLPSLELGRRISDRMKLSAELSVPIANDWFYDYGVNENVKSLSLSVGMGFLF